MAKRPPASWIVQQQSAEGPLNDAQIEQLAVDFDIPRDSLRSLSSSLAHPLSDRFRSLSVLRTFKQWEKGSSELEKLIKEMRQAKLRLTKAAEIFSAVRFEYPEADHRKGDPNLLYRKMLDKVLNDVELINHSLIQNAVQYGASFTGEPDKRRNRDNRRSAVLIRIFDTWHNAGRNVSVTTNPETSKRTGPLVDFINAVVRCITDPVTEINGQTIWEELKAWRHRQKGPWT